MFSFAGVVFFFAPALGAGTGPEQKKNTTQWCFFFAPAPGSLFWLGEGEASLGAGTGPAAKKKTPPSGVSFFDPALGARHGAQSKIKKNTAGPVFFASGPRGKAGEGEAPLGCRHGARAKTQVVFFFLLWPRPGRSGRGRRSAVGRRHGVRAKK